MEKLQTSNLSYFLGKDFLHVFSVFKIYFFINQHLYELKEDKSTEYIISWKSKGLFKFNLKPLFNPLIL